MDINPPKDVSMEATYNLLLEPEFRRNLRNLDLPALGKVGYTNYEAVKDEFDIAVVTSTKDTTYINMPPSDLSKYPINVEHLAQIDAAGTSGTAGSASTIGTAGTASTLATSSSTASTFGCIGSLGSAGTAGSLD